LKACRASGGSGPDLYPESFLVTLKTGAAMVAKILMCAQKKLQRPTKDHFDIGRRFGILDCL